MDASITRRGQPCWYRKDGVGTIAINDSFILESCIFIFLKKYFKNTSYYIDLVELFHEVSFQTQLGQLCDLITAPEDHVDLSKFSPQKWVLSLWEWVSGHGSLTLVRWRHQFIVIYKTAYYSFYLPVVLALHMVSWSPYEGEQWHDRITHLVFNRLASTTLRLSSNAMISWFLSVNTSRSKTITLTAMATLLSSARSVLIFKTTSALGLLTKPWSLPALSSARSLTWVRQSETESGWCLNSSTDWWRL